MNPVEDVPDGRVIVAIGATCEGDAGAFGQQRARILARALASRKSRLSIMADGQRAMIDAGSGARCPGLAGVNAELIGGGFAQEFHRVAAFDERDAFGDLRARVRPSALRCHPVRAEGAFGACSLSSRSRSIRSPARWKMLTRFQSRSSRSGSMPCVDQRWSQARRTCRRLRRRQGGHREAAAGRVRPRRADSRRAAFPGGDGGGGARSSGVGCRSGNRGACHDGLRVLSRASRGLRGDDQRRRARACTARKRAAGAPAEDGEARQFCFAMQRGAAPAENSRSAAIAVPVSAAAVAPSRRPRAWRPSRTGRGGHAPHCPAKIPRLPASFAHSLRNRTASVALSCTRMAAANRSWP